MTCRAIRFDLDTVLLHQLLSQFQLIGRRLIVHAKDKLARAHVFSRIAMTVETPSHLECLGFPGSRHLVHLPMTRRAANPFLDVNAVIKIHKVRERVDARPLNRHTALKTRAHGLENGAVGKKLCVAIHAGLSGRKTRKGRRLGGGVAVPAVNAVVANVMLVTEGDRLCRRDADARQIWGADDDSRDEEHARDNKGGAKDAHAGKGIRAPMKDLSHLNFRVVVDANQMGLLWITPQAAGYDAIPKHACPTPRVARRYFYDSELPVADGAGMVYKFIDKTHTTRIL
jgi:hypothetical protein